MRSAEGVGVIGILCEARTQARVVRKTSRGPLWPAVCNRWYLHDGPHRQTRLTDFATLATWGEAQCAAPDPMAQRRKEMALAARGVEVTVVERQGTLT